MYKRDLISAEIEKLAQVLAKIMGLKTEGRISESENLFSQTLENSFLLPTAIINSEKLEVFKDWLATNKKIEAEYLQSLSEYLYYALENDLNNKQRIAEKLNYIYETLNYQYKILHLSNLQKQQFIKQYL